MKTCKYCKIRKSLLEFYKKQAGCKECIKSLSNEYTKNHYEEKMAYNAQYAIDHREEIKLRRQIRYLENKDKILQDRAQYYLDNSEQIKATRKLYVIKNTDKINSLSRKRKAAKLNRIPKW